MFLNEETTKQRHNKEQREGHSLKKDPLVRKEREELFIRNLTPSTGD